MTDPLQRQKKIIRNLPDTTAARQEQSLRDFRDTVGYFNEQMFNLGLCDGNSCKFHRVKSGMHQHTCYCKRSLDATSPKEKRYWDKMHWENCGAGRSMERNVGCKGYEGEGLPLYQERHIGRKVV